MTKLNIFSLLQSKIISYYDYSTFYIAFVGLGLIRWYSVLFGCLKILPIKAEKQQQKKIIMAGSGPIEKLQQLENIEKDISSALQSAGMNFQM